MVLQLYAIYDLVAEDFGPPFTAKNDAVACRNFLRSMPKEVNVREFVLYKIGSYCTVDGIVESQTPGQVEFNLKEVSNE